MNTSSSKLQGIINSKADMLSALQEQNRPVDNTTPLSEYAEQIRLIESSGSATIIPKTITENGTFMASSEGADGYNPVTVNVPIGSEEWTRPEDRPAVPILNSNEAYYLFKVTPTGINDMALQFTFSPTTGTGQVDWGDGTVQTLTHNVKLDHLYDFNSIPSTISSDGNKWVWIKVYNIQATSYTQTLGVRPSTRPVASGTTNVYIPNIIEYYVNFPNGYINFAGGTGTFYRQLDLCRTIAISVVNGQPNSLTNLRIAEFNDNSFVYNSSFLSGCYLTEKIVFLDGSTTLKISGNNPNFSGNNLYSLKTLELDLSLATGTLNLTSMVSLTNLRISNANNITAVNITNTNLNKQSMSTLFNDLPDRTSLTAGTITINQTPAASQLTASDIAFLTAKNWTVVGWIGY